MASISAVSMGSPIITRTGCKTPFFSPLTVKPQRATVMVQRSNETMRRQLKVEVSFKEKAMSGLTAAALTASMMVPDVAEAAELVPSLKNFVLSIVSGGVVLTAILGAVIAVSNFDPVKRA